MNSPPKEPPLKETPASEYLSATSISQSEDEANSALAKAPGWRLSSNSKLKIKEKRPRSTEDGLGLGLTSNIASETSISSNGPLRHWYRNEKSTVPIKQLSPMLMKLAANLKKDIKKEDRVSVKEEKGEKFLKEVSTSGIGQGKLACPVDPMTGGFIDSSLEQFKLRYEEDDDPFDTKSQNEKSFRSGKSLQPNEKTIRKGNDPVIGFLTKTVIAKSSTDGGGQDSSSSLPNPKGPSSS